LRQLPGGRRALWTGFFILICALLVSAFIWFPAYTAFDTQYQALVQVKRQTANHMRQQENQQQLLTAQALIDTWQKTYARNGSFSQSDLISQVRRYAGAAGVHIKNQLFDNTHKLPNMHALELDIGGTYPQIRRFVQNLSDRNPLMFIQQLNMSVDDDNSTSLRARLVIRSVSHLRPVMSEPS
ncbi:MAG: hypothetical protein OEY29_15955, partial [Gammaproteobacteria bacterium]|nr:hypothetical protein [Gammaproteobacteria bacterium]